jgi:hypothetical protein
MRHYFHVVVGSVALLVGILLLSTGHAAEPERGEVVQLIPSKQSVMQPYVATPADIAHAHELTKQFYAQPIPRPAMRTSPQQTTARPSAWPTIKHDDPRSLGGGYVMQMVYPKPGVQCSIIRRESEVPNDGTGTSILDSGCKVHPIGE